MSFFHFVGSLLCIELEALLLHVIVSYRIPRHVGLENRRLVAFVPGAFDDLDPSRE